MKEKNKRNKAEELNALNDGEGIKYMTAVFRLQGTGYHLSKRFRVPSSYYRKCVSKLYNSHSNVIWSKLFSDCIKTATAGTTDKTKVTILKNNGIKTISSMYGVRFNISLRNYTDELPKGLMDRIWDDFIDAIKEDINKHNDALKEEGKGVKEEVLDTPQHPQSSQSNHSIHLSETVTIAAKEEVNKDETLRLQLASLLRKHTDAKSTIILSQLIFILGALKKLPLKPGADDILINKIQRFVNEYLTDGIDLKLFDYFIKEFTNDINEDLYTVQDLDKIDKKVMLSTWEIMSLGFSIYR